MEWFVSDFHFGHFNILLYDDRPFATVKEHDGALLKNVQECVNHSDTLYIVGDLLFGNSNRVEYLMTQLPGRKYYVRGNHDNKKTIKEIKKHTEDGTIHDILTVSPHGQPIVLCHYPMITWDKEFHGSWHVHGHDHKTADYGDGKKRFNVAINLNNYRPFSFEQLKERLV